MTRLGSALGWFAGSARSAGTPSHAGGAPCCHDAEFDLQSAVLALPMTDYWSSSNLERSISEIKAVLERAADVH